MGPHVMYFGGKIHDFFHKLKRSQLILADKFSKLSKARQVENIGDFPEMDKQMGTSIKLVTMDYNMNAHQTKLNTEYNSEHGVQSCEAGL